MTDHSSVLPEHISDAIDAHVHCWSGDKLPSVIVAAAAARPDLTEDYSAPRLISSAKANGLAGIILVQACDLHDGGLAEAEYFVQAATRHPEIKGCIIGIDLLDTAATEQLLLQLRPHKVICGGRMISPENSGVGILSDARTQSTAKLLGEYGLTLDLLIRSRNPGQLDEAVALVQWLSEHSSTRVVGDHMLKPTGMNEGKPGSEWLTALINLAACDNFYLKLSGMAGETNADTPPENFYPFFDAALNILGADKLLFGSDHPVSFAQRDAVSAISSWLALRGLAENGKATQIFSTTARKAYRLLD